MKKILLIPEYGKNGGTRTYFIQLMEFYYLQKFHVTIALSESDYDDEIKNLVDKYNFNIIFISTKKVSITKSKNFNNIFSMIKQLLIIFKLKFKIKFDLLVVSTGSHSYFISSFFLPIKSIFVLHTIPERKENKILRFFLQKSLSYNKNIVTVSKASKNNIEEKLLMGTENKNVKIIGNYYSMKNIVIDNQGKKDKIIVLTLGHVVKYKNPNFCIEVAYKIHKVNKNIEFIWAGEGTELDNCNKKIIELGINNIKFIGYVSDVQSLYNTASIYVQCSLLESQSISILGAMANAIPCIGTNVGGIPECIRDNENGYIVDKTDVDAAVNYINILANNIEMRKKMGNKSKELYDLYHDEKVWYDNMDILYKTILK